MAFSLLDFTLPSWAKVVLALVLAWNIRALPLVWHVRVLEPVARLYLMRKDRRKLVLHTKGQEPTTVKRVVPGFRVWPNDVDYNLHKSNSTYAADMDVARSNVAIDWFAPFLAVGGLLPIAGTTHLFLNELKPMQKFDIEISYGGFGEKWIYCVGVFVTRPKKGAKRVPAVPETPATGLTSGTTSPAPFKKLVATRLDGAAVHCVSVSIFCFKLGRLTIPPAVVLSMCAYGDASNHARFERLHKAGPGATIKYLKGGWKEDEEAVKAVEGFAEEGRNMGDKGEAMRKALEEFGVNAPV